MPDRSKLSQEDRDRLEKMDQDAEKAKAELIAQINKADASTLIGIMVVISWIINNWRTAGYKRLCLIARNIGPVLDQRISALRTSGQETQPHPDEKK